jgi:hypothetical protein
MCRKIVTIMPTAMTACTMCATCIWPRVYCMPGIRWSSTRPEPATSRPISTTPSQNTTFSPALKRPDGGSCWPFRMRAELRSHTPSWRRGISSRANVTMTMSSDTTNSGPTKLCTVFSA